MLESKEQLNYEESFAKLYVSSIINLRDSTMSIANFYDNKCKMIRQQIYDLKEEEPLKIFKRSHTKWENNLQKLQEKYDDTFTKFLDECIELENVTKLFNV